MAGLSWPLLASSTVVTAAAASYGAAGAAAIAPFRPALSAPFRLR